MNPLIPFTLLRRFVICIDDESNTSFCHDIGMNMCLGVPGEAGTQSISAVL
jgi:hypothetical protein